MPDNHDTSAQDRSFWERTQTDEPAGPASADAPGANAEALGSPLDDLLAYRRLVGDPATEPPAGLATRMVSLLGRVRPDLISSDRPSLADQAVSALRRITASLSIDTATLAQGVAGLRGTTASQTRQVAFVSEAADLDLELTSGSSPDLPIFVTGQLGMTAVPTDQTIWFVPAGQVPATGEIEPAAIENTLEAAVDEDGYFRLTISPGDWVGLVEIGDAVVLFRDIRV